MIVRTADRDRPLYVCRPVLNAAQLHDWGGAQGFASMLPANDLHVTICYSKAAVDWGAVPPKPRRLRVLHGCRDVTKLGDKGAVVLRFQSNMLTTRWRAFREAGAAWDYPHYQPHVTLSYDIGGLDLDTVRPYRGPILLGGEVYAPLDEERSAKLAEVTVAETACSMRRWIDATTAWSGGRISKRNHHVQDDAVSVAAKGA